MTAPSVEQLNPFQRIVAPLSVTYAPDDLSSSANAGRVGDLRVVTVAAPGAASAEPKARLVWTSPDMGGSPTVARYEVRYSLSLRPLLDHFDAATAWTRDSPLPLAPGSETAFALDLSGSPELLDRPLFVALRAYAQAAPDSVPGPASNWVRVLVPSPPPPPPPPSSPGNTHHHRHHSSGDGDPSWTAADHQNGNGAGSVIPRIARDIEMNYDVLVPAAGGVTLLALLALVYCVFCAVQRKRNRKPEKHSPPPSSQHHQQQQQQQEKSLNVSVIPNGGGPLSISSPIMDAKTEPPTLLLDSTRYEPCLMDAGIDPKKRYSVVAGTVVPPHYGSAAANDQHHHYQQQQQQQYQQQQSSNNAPYHHQSNGHLTVVGGGATLTRAPKPLSPYQSWTASQLLHEHERRTSPYGQLADFDGQYPPPVPPLPAYQQQQQQQQQPQQLQLQGNAENIYGTAPGGHYQQQQQQNGLPAPGQYGHQFQRNNNMILFNQSLQGSLSSVSSGDKKKRNITMV